LNSKILYQAKYYRIELLPEGTMHDDSFVNYVVVSVQNDRAEYYTLDYPSALMTAKNFEQALDGVFGKELPKLN